MTDPTSPTAVCFDEAKMWVDLEDGRTLGIPLAWFPRLFQGTPEQRQAVELSRAGLHWEALNEDISIAGLLTGCGDMTRALTQRRDAENSRKVWHSFDRRK